MHAAENIHPATACTANTAVSLQAVIFSPKKKRNSHPRLWSPSCASSMLIISMCSSNHFGRPSYLPSAPSETFGSDRMYAFASSRQELQAPLTIIPNISVEHHVFVRRAGRSTYSQVVPPLYLLTLSTSRPLSAMTCAMSLFHQQP